MITKEKVNYEREKVKKLEEKITKEGGRVSIPLINLDANLKVIKDLLFEKKLIEKDKFEWEFFKKVQILLENILIQIKKIKKEKSGLIIPKANVDLSKIKSEVKA